MQISFSSVEDLDNGFSCGGYSNLFRYLEGPVADSAFTFGADILSQFNFSLVLSPMITLEGRILDRAWIGTHKIQV